MGLSRNLTFSSSDLQASLDDEIDEWGFNRGLSQITPSTIQRYARVLASVLRYCWNRRASAATDGVPTDADFASASDEDICSSIFDFLVSNEWSPVTSSNTPSAVGAKIGVMSQAVAAFCLVDKRVGAARLARLTLGKDLGLCESSVLAAMSSALMTVIKSVLVLNHMWYNGSSRGICFQNSFCGGQFAHIRSEVGSLHEQAGTDNVIMDQIESQKRGELTLQISRGKEEPFVVSLTDIRSAAGRAISQCQRLFKEALNRIGVPFVVAEAVTR